MRIREVVRWREPRGVQGEWSGLADHTWYFPMCDQRGRVSQVVILDCDGTNGRRPAVRVQRDRGPSKSTDAAGSSDVLIRSHRSLTAAETQVLRLIIVEGMSNREAAEHLCRAERTIEAHRYSIMRKLHAHNVVDLVKQAIQQGLVRVRSG